MGAGKYDGAKKTIKNINQKLRSAEQRDCEFKPKGLMQALKDSGEKYTEKDVIFIVKQQNGKIAWLEEGKETAGWKHVKKHSMNFKSIGIKEDLIPELIREAITHGKVIGYQKTKNQFPREVYEVEFMKENIKIAISISDNGFIVGANPIQREKEIIRIK